MNEISSERSKSRRHILPIALVFTTLLLMMPTLCTPISAAVLPPPPVGWNFRAAGGWDKIEDIVPLASGYVTYIKDEFGFDLPSIPPDIHLWTYAVYINWSNSQTFFAGFINFTSSTTNFTMPEQLLVQHFTTRDGNDAVFAASFTMLAVLNQTDEMYGSFTLGKEYDLGKLHAQDSSIPASTSGKASVLPLWHSADSNTWTWGMKYINLTTLWWRMFPSNSSHGSVPFAVMLFDELSFNYTLTIVPATSANPMGNITTRVDYAIGNVSNVWHVKSYDPVNVEHFSSSSAHTFLANMKISILQHQKTSVYGKPVSITSGGTVVRNASADVSSSGINGTVGNELICSTNFGSKRNYRLYSTAAGTVESATVKTYPFKGIVDNSIFNDTYSIYSKIHRVASYVPAFFGRGLDVALASTDVVFMISYPNWSGYRIVHDPYFAVYTSSPGEGAGLEGTSTALLALVVGAALVVVTSVVVVQARAKKRGK